MRQEELEQMPSFSSSLIPLASALTGFPPAALLGLTKVVTCVPLANTCISNRSSHLESWIEILLHPGYGSSI